MHSEDHQDDSASCLEARSLTNVLREDTRAGPSLDDIPAQFLTDGSHHYPDQIRDATASIQGAAKNGPAIR